LKKLFIPKVILGETLPPSWVKLSPHHPENLGETLPPSYINTYSSSGSWSPSAVDNFQKQSTASLRYADKRSAFGASKFEQGRGEPPSLKPIPRTSSKHVDGLQCSTKLEALSKGNTGAGALLVNTDRHEGTARSDTGQALAMFSAFASVGARSFDVTLLDMEGREQGFQSSRSLEELRRSIGKRLDAAERLQQSIVIRPRSTTSLLIQLDDFTGDKAGQMEPYSFLSLETSPGNFQVWLAVSDGPKEVEAAKRFRTRVRRGTEADQSATGATRIAGSINFKPKYAPGFPVVSIHYGNPGKTITTAELEQKGFLAPEIEPQPPASAPPQPTPPPGRKAIGSGPQPHHWPDYQRALSGAPKKGDGTPDRSLADFMFCKWAAERGHSVEAIAAKLAEVSDKAKERIRVKEDKGYPLLTARNATAALERDRGRRQPPKKPGPR